MFRQFQFVGRGLAFVLRDKMFTVASDCDCDQLGKSALLIVSKQHDMLNQNP